MLIIVVMPMEVCPGRTESDITEAYVCPQKQEALLSGIVEPQLQNGHWSRKTDPFNN